MEKEEWKPFRNVLDKSDRKKFLMKCLISIYISACANSVQCCRFEKWFQPTWILGVLWSVFISNYKYLFIDDRFVLWSFFCVLQSFLYRFSCGVMDWTDQIEGTKLTQYADSWKQTNYLSGNTLTTLIAVLPWKINCYNPHCAVGGIIDNSNVMTELNEMNNRDARIDRWWNLKPNKRQAPKMSSIQYRN